MKRDHIFGLVLAAIALALFYLFHKSGLLHESVTASIITPQGTVTSNPQTGYPQFDSRSPATIPAARADAVAPIDTNGAITQFPKDVLGCTCPIGTQKWQDVSDGSVWCIPT